MHPMITEAARSGHMGVKETIPEAGIKISVLFVPGIGTGFFPEGDDCARRYKIRHDTDSTKAVARLP